MSKPGVHCGSSTSQLLNRQRRSHFKSGHFKNRPEKESAPLVKRARQNSRSGNFLRETTITSFDYRSRTMQKMWEVKNGWLG